MTLLEWYKNKFGNQDYNIEELLNEFEDAKTRLENGDNYVD